MPTLKRTLLSIFSEGNARELSGIRLNIFIAVGFLVSLYQIWSVTLAKIEPITQMSIHLSFILVLTFFLFNYSKQIKANKLLITIDGLLILLSISAGIYYIMHAERIAMRAVGVDVLTGWDIFFGLVLVALCIEAARRTIGFSIILVALAFIAYALFGHLLNGVWYHREMSGTEV